MNTEEKNRYFQELTLNLQRGGFTVGLEADGILPVELDSQRLCQITDSGGVRYWKEELTSDTRHILTCKHKINGGNAIRHSSILL